MWWLAVLQEVDGRFSRAMELTGKEFLESVDYLAKACVAVL